MHFDWTISFGTVAQTLILVGAIVTAATRFSRLETKVDMLYTWWEREIERRNNRDRRSEGLQN